MVCSNQPTEDGRVTRKLVATETCPMTGDVTAFFSDKTAVKIDRRAFERDPFYAIEVMAQAKVDCTQRVDVFQYGSKVGELPSWWTPACAKTSSFLYDYRDGDLKMIDGKWVADRTLGASDLDLLVGFVRKPSPTPNQEQSQ